MDRKYMKEMYFDQLAYDRVKYMSTLFEMYKHFISQMYQILSFNAFDDSIEKIWHFTLNIL